MTDMLVTIDDYAGFMAELADRAAEQGFYGFQDLCLLVAEALTALPADGLTTELASLLAALPQLYEDYSQGDGAVVGTVLTILQYPDLAVELADDELLMLANQLTTDITPLTDEASPLEFYPAVSEPDFEPLASLDEKILSLEPDTSPVISKATLELVTLLHTEALLIDGILCSISIDQADTVATALEQLSDELGRYINASNMAGFEGLALICTQVDTNIQYFLNDVSGFTATHHGLLQNWVAEVIGYLGNFSDSDAGLPLLCLLGSADWPLPIPLEDAGVVMAHFKATDANLSGYEPEPRKQLATSDDVALALPEDVNPELLEVLLHELPLQIQDFSAAIQRLQAGGNLADLEIAQRVAHTVKGAANTVGIKGIAELTHQLEDILLAFANQQQLPGNTLLEALMAAADCLEAMGESLTGFAPPPDDAVLILQSVLDWANLIDQNGIPVSDDAPDHTAIAQLPEDKPDISVGKETLPTTTFVRVSSEHLDDMFKLADENVILVSQANERLRRMKLQLRAMEAQIELLRQLGDELEQLVDLKDFTGQAVGNPKADFDTLEMDQYNELHTASRRMVEAAFDAREITKDAGKELDAMAWVLEDQQRLGNETQAVIMQTRLIPVASIAQRL